MPNGKQRNLERELDQEIWTECFQYSRRSEDDGDGITDKPEVNQTVASAAIATLVHMNSPLSTAVLLIITNNAFQCRNNYH